MVRLLYAIDLARTPHLLLQFPHVCPSLTSPLLLVHWRIDRQRLQCHEIRQEPANPKAGLVSHKCINFLVAGRRCCDMETSKYITIGDFPVVIVKSGRKLEL